MSVIKIEQDIKLLENKLKEIDVTITDPIERNEQKKEIKKKISKLKRTKSQIEQLEKEQLELESLKSNFIANSAEPNKSTESEVSDKDRTKIEVETTESIPTVASQLDNANPTSDSNKQFEIPWIKILLFIITGLFLTTTISVALMFSYNNNLKTKEAKLEEIARRKVIEAEAEIEQARKESQEARAAIERAKRLKQKSIQASNKVEIIQRKSTNTRKVISPRDFIEKHYSDLNNRNYYSTWNYLTAQFQNKSKSFDDYKDWWDSVERTEIGRIQVLKQTSSTALLDVQLTYVMKTDKVYQDPRSRIYLVWDEYANSWVFKDKQYKYFYDYQFPTASCGDRDPGGTNTWYPVFIKNTEHNFNEVRDRFCRDAIRKYREYRQSTSIQVASFTDRDKAEEFALILKINLGTGEVGQPKVRNFDNELLF